VTSPTDYLVLAASESILGGDTVPVYVLVGGSPLTGVAFTRVFREGNQLVDDEDLDDPFEPAQMEEGAVIEGSESELDLAVPIGLPDGCFSETITATYLVHGAAGRTSSIADRYWVVEAGVPRIVGLREYSRLELPLVWGPNRDGQMVEMFAGTTPEWPVVQPELAPIPPEAEDVAPLNEQGFGDESNED
jgi:hypothetical protein